MDYIKLVMSSIDYVEENIDQELTLERISKKFFISKFHFHRIFKAVINYTLSEYIHKRRMSISLDLLKNTNSSIIEVALNCGINSNESFSRKFKNEFGMTPSNYRKNKLVFPSFERINVLGRDFMNKNNDIVVNYRIVDLPKEHLKGTYRNNFQDDFSDNSVGIEVFEFADDCFVNNIDGKLYVITLYLNEESGEMQYFAGFNDIKQPIEDLESLTLQESRYIVFTYYGVFREMIDIIIKDIYRCISIANLIIRKTGVEFFEVYDDNYFATWKFEIYVPIE